MIYVCPARDIECGNNQARWCTSCPRAAADILSKKVSFDVTMGGTTFKAGLSVGMVIRELINRVSRQERFAPLNEEQRKTLRALFGGTVADAQQSRAEARDD